MRVYERTRARAAQPEGGGGGRAGEAAGIDAVPAGARHRQVAEPVDPPARGHRQRGGPAAVRLALP
eukprot:907361-Prorocentrum_minimum.AAC.1